MPIRLIIGMRLFLPSSAIGADTRQIKRTANPGEPKRAFTRENCPGIILARARQNSTRAPLKMQAFQLVMMPMSPAASTARPGQGLENAPNNAAATGKSELASAVRGTGEA